MDRRPVELLAVRAIKHLERGVPDTVWVGAESDANVVVHLARAQEDFRPPPRKEDMQVFVEHQAREAWVTAGLGDRVDLGKLCYPDWSADAGCCAEGWYFGDLSDVPTNERGFICDGKELAAHRVVVMTFVMPKKKPVLAEGAPEPEPEPEPEDEEDGKAEAEEPSL